MPDPLDRALGVARELARTPELPPPDGRPRSRRLAVGDPQAPLRTFLTVLASRDLLGSHGLLRPEVLLVSMGDHFDWGPVAARAQAAADGLALLAWLAAHPPDQVVLLAGNHDLGRVGELLHLDQAGFEAAHAEALALYTPGRLDRAAERAFLARHPSFPSTEAAARDFSCFRVEQRELVVALLRSGRLHLGWAGGPHALFVHAGLTAAELDVLGIPPSSWSDAPVLAAALDAALQAAVSAWSDAPFEVPGLHRPGSAAGGEGGGMLYHRPADPARGAQGEFSGPARRRYDPRRLPRGLTQHIGHVRDAKCRVLLPDWTDGAEAREGLLRHLRTDGNAVAYAHGLPAEPRPGEARILFLDAGMAHTDPARYPLYDLDAERAV
jgi:hypothetical protein